MTDSELKKLNHMVRVANNRLRRMQEYTGKDVSWSAYNLQARLEGKTGAWSKNNLIELNDTMSDQDLTRVLSATTKFLKSRVSTITGIKDVIRETKKTMRGDLDLTKEQAEAYYRMLQDDNFTFFQDKSAARSSEMWAIVEEAKEKHLSYGQFELKMLEAGKIDAENFRKIPDLELRASIKSIYDTDVKEE